MDTHIHRGKYNENDVWERGLQGLALIAPPSRCVTLTEELTPPHLSTTGILIALFCVVFWHQVRPYMQEHPLGAHKGTVMG